MKILGLDYTSITYFPQQNTSNMGTHNPLTQPVKHLLSHPPHAITLPFSGANGLQSFISTAEHFCPRLTDRVTSHTTGPERKNTVAPKPLP
jgi:hypothetical protein